MYIFTQTTTGARTNITANFPIWDKKMFVEHVKSGKGYGRYRYSAIGGYMDLLKGMSLEEFEQVFSSEDFTTEEITGLFRKEISEKYGEHVEKAKIKPLSKKVLERGCIYKDFSGSTWLYLGEVEQTVDITYTKKYQSDKRPNIVTKGYGFQHWWRSDNPVSCDPHIIQSPKRLAEKVDGEKIELEAEYIHETKDTSWSSGKRTVLKLL